MNRPEHLWKISVEREGKNECYYQGKLLKLTIPNITFYSYVDVTEEAVREILEGTEGIVSIDIEKTR